MNAVLVVQMEFPHPQNAATQSANRITLRPFGSQRIVHAYGPAMELATGDQGHIRFCELSAKGDAYEARITFRELIPFLHGRGRHRPPPCCASNLRCSGQRFEERTKALSERQMSNYSVA